MDANGMSTSLTQRRQATQNLPVFELPPPNFAASQYQHKFPPLSGIGIQPIPATVSAGNLLTPPPNSASDSGPSTGPMQGHHMPVLPYTPTFWQGPGATPGFNPGLAPSPWQSNQMYHSRPMFSPRPDHTSPSGAAPISLPPPPYDISSLPPYGQAVHLASPVSAVSQGSQHPGMTSSIMTHQGRNSNQLSPVSPADAASKAASQPSLVSTMSAPSPSQNPYGFHAPTPVSQSPHAPSASVTSASPPLHQGASAHMQSQSRGFIKPPYPSYTLPAMPGAVLTNVNNPGGPMNLLGNVQAQMLPIHFNSAYAANPQMAYAQARANSPQQNANQDRPFKCDECPQSFNRNHDLKRHKRIHLAVKPFPCGHCEKSFSRKDALKRHILVKGCKNDDAAKAESSSDCNES